MKRWFVKYWPALVILGVSLILLRSFFRPGFPETHDGQLYLARMANFHLAAIDWHFPVRWAPNLNYKFGYPVFLFNYYVPYILALVPVVLGADFELSFKLLAIFSLFIGGFFWFLLVRKKFNPSAGLVAGLLYVAAPYQMLDILVRFSVGEIVAMGALPALLWAFDLLITKPGKIHFLLATLGLAAFSLTHNILFLFGAPVLAAFCLADAFSLPGKKFKRLSPVILSFLLAAGLTLFFWAPALLEKKYTNIDQLDQMQVEYANHILNLKQMIYSPWGFGYSYPGPNDNMSLQLGPIHWLIVLISFWLLVKTWSKSKKIDPLWLFFSLVFVVSVLAMLPLSLPVWRVLPLVRYVQFPWRLLAFATLAAAGLSAWVVKSIPKVSWVLTAAAVIYVTALATKPGGWFNWDNYYYYEFPFNTLIMSANTPRWFDENKNIKLTPGHFFDLRGISSFVELAWDTQKHLYQIDAPDDTEVLERTSYFPGWQVTVDGRKTEIDYQKTEYPGIITFKVPAGKHLIETKFTENTPARILGDSVSLVSLVALLIILETGWLLKPTKPK
ncbi:hypothetical protein A3J22_01915 [Candidatus Beckwithbacteria bacterium RIFCSPLOWO2_02_FULL_49_12]|nr:MAG: hypothetical protein A3J22_01915 [Candidatus Beckwithbacteria bacterium RIFCSPLOWO2_02_FULL_49_12]